MPYSDKDVIIKVINMEELEIFNPSLLRHSFGAGPRLETENSTDLQWGMKLLFIINDNIILLLLLL
jgi:hypothetical protein